MKCKHFAFIKLAIDNWLLSINLSINENKINVKDYPTILDILLIKKDSEGI